MSICPVPALAAASPGGTATDTGPDAVPVPLAAAAGAAGGGNAAAAGLATRPGFGEPVAATPDTAVASGGDPSPEPNRWPAALGLEPGAGAAAAGGRAPILFCGGLRGSARTA